MTEDRAALVAQDAIVRARRYARELDRLKPRLAQTLEELADFAARTLAQQPDHAAQLAAKDAEIALLRSDARVMSVASAEGNRRTVPAAEARNSRTHRGRAMTRRFYSLSEILCFVVGSHRPIWAVGTATGFACRSCGQACSQSGGRP